MNSDLLAFEMVFPPRAYTGMSALKLTPKPDGTIRPATWRSIDFGQTFSVTINEDKALELTVVTVTNRLSDTISLDESDMVLDQFYPNRTVTRVDNSGKPNAIKYAVWPGKSDHQLPWYSQQLTAHG